MMERWSFGKRVGAGFSVAIAFTVTMGIVAVWALQSVIARKDQVITVHARNTSDAARLDAAAERRITGVRGFLLTGQQRYLDHLTEANAEFRRIQRRLRTNVRDAESRRLLDDVERAGSIHQRAVERVVARRRAGAPAEEIQSLFDSEVIPRRDALDNSIRHFTDHQEELAARAREDAEGTASAAITLLLTMAILSTLLSVGGSVLLARSLAARIGESVSRVQTSSTELQTTANQQATGARQQATAMNEITTTMTELLATSRQIAESAQRVAGIADRTAACARSGEKTVHAAQEAIGGIEKQVDAIAAHTIDLGRKSQQIGGIVQIIDELAEQTNILAINATIEAAGAGESGRRFAVVAEEIRKLADRVAGSTREIRDLVDEIRAAVNTTVMAAEGGAKAVDVGVRGVGDVASAFGEIAELVSTTTEAAREIGMSTKQQTTAVEQVNVAIASTAQATRETETTSQQVLQTASELSTLSRDLRRIVEPRANA